MPIKGIFEQYPNDEFFIELLNKLEKLETQAQRIDALEGQMKHLLILEQQFSNQMMELEKNFTLLQAHINKHFKKLYNSIGKTSPNNHLNIEQDYSLLKLQMEEYLEEIHSFKEELKLTKLNQKESSSQQPIIFQEYKIEHVTIDNYELNNNIAQLGVKELSGQLNIGATYGKVMPEIMEEMNEQLEELKGKKDDLIQKKEQGLHEKNESSEVL